MFVVEDLTLDRKWKHGTQLVGLLDPWLAECVSLCWTQYRTEHRQRTRKNTVIQINSRVRENSTSADTTNVQEPKASVHKRVAHSVESTDLTL